VKLTSKDVVSEELERRNSEEANNERMNPGSIDFGGTAYRNFVNYLGDGNSSG